MVCEVSKVGSEVKDFKKGDLVGFGTQRDSCDKCKWCLRGEEEVCPDVKERGTYGKYWGGYATAVQQPAKFFFHLPDKFDLKRGPPLFCAGITTFYPMRKFLKEGMNTAVVGVGGLGHLAIQFLHKLGHKVTAFTQSKDKIPLIKQLGGDDVIISSDPEQMKAAQGKFDFVINTSSVFDNVDDYINTVSLCGYYVQVGAGPVSDAKVTFNIFSVIVKEVKIVGSIVGPRHVINDMVKICVDKDIYPMVEEFSFEDFPKAFNRLENERPKFRCVVNVKDYAEKNGFKK